MSTDPRVVHGIDTTLICCVELLWTKLLLTLDSRAWASLMTRAMSTLGGGGSTGFRGWGFLEFQRVKGFWGAGGLGVVVVGVSLVASGRGGQTGLTPPPAGPGLGATGRPGLSPAPCPVTLTSAGLSSTVYSVQDRSLYTWLYRTEYGVHGAPYRTVSVCTVDCTLYSILYTAVYSKLYRANSSWKAAR